MLDFLMLMVPDLLAGFLHYAEQRAAQEPRTPPDVVQSTQSRPVWDDGLSDWDMLRASGRPDYWM